jgi:NUDIX domain
MGRGNEDYNLGLFVLPGGEVGDGESLEQTLQREIRQSTGFEMVKKTDRWKRPHVIESDDRVILVGEGRIRKSDEIPRPDPKKDTLYNIGWFSSIDNSSTIDGCSTMIIRDFLNVPKTTPINPQTILPVIRDFLNRIGHQHLFLQSQ